MAFMCKFPAHCPIQRTTGDNDVCHPFATMTIDNFFAPFKTCSKLCQGPKSKRMYGETPSSVI
eukprot:scaffold83_cov390-Pavlova_lutheri.AAC.5